MNFAPRFVPLLFPALLSADPQFGSVEITQLNSTNNGLASSSPSLTMSFGPGTSLGPTILSNSNRADYDLSFSNGEGPGQGVLISSIAQNSRDDSLVGGPASGTFYATSSFGPNEAGADHYWIALHRSQEGDEANHDVSFAYFPYDEWLGGVARNTVGNGELTELEGSSGLTLGVEFIDSDTSNGEYQLDLSRIVPDASSNGILLVTGARNEDNYALSRANSDGSFTIFCHDNGVDKSTYENDSVGFVYIPLSAVGTRSLAACGRVTGDGSQEVGAGTFAVSKGGTGEWFLTIEGHSDSSGTLVISPEGGDTNNVDNIVSHEWQAAESRWRITSRDLTGSTGSPNLQNLARSDEDLFSFVFLTLEELNLPPEVTLTSPALGVQVPLGTPISLTATASDADGIAQVDFYEQFEALTSDETAPYTGPWIPNTLGPTTLSARAIDEEGAISESPSVSVHVVPESGSEGLYFDGVDDHVALGEESNLTLANFTLECWFRKETGGLPTSTGDAGVSAIPLIARGGGASADGTNNATCNYFLGIEAETGVLAVDFKDRTGSRNYPAQGVTVIEDGVWYHTAVTFDSASDEWRIYLNGQLESVTSTNGQGPYLDLTTQTSFGTAMSSSNQPAGSFHGFLDEVRIWDTALPLAAIQETLNQPPTQVTDHLVAHYGMNELSGVILFSSATPDYSGTLVNGTYRTGGAPLDLEVPPYADLISPTHQESGVTLDVPLTIEVGDVDSANLSVIFRGRRVGEASNLEDFSVIALPDSQYYSQNTGGSRAQLFSAQTDWIVSQRNQRNIAFTMHLGDIVQSGDKEGDASEWLNATNALYRLEDANTTLLEDGMPYSVAVGNHDQSPIGDADGTTTFFNTFFGVHPTTQVNHFTDKSYYGGTSEPTLADNNYCLFSASGLDFIVISLEYDTSPDAADLQWADNLLKAYPNHRGIIVTHYLVRTGNPAPFSTQGEAIYEALKDNPNLLLMHGGHISGEGQRTDVYDGRAVHSLLADFQGRSNGGNSWLRILTFKPSTNQIQVETYSPALDEYEIDDNSSFTLEVDLSGGLEPFKLLAAAATTGGSVTVTWADLEPSQTYEWYVEVSDGDTTITSERQTFTTSGTDFPPTVSLTSPLNGHEFEAPASVELMADAADGDGQIVSVDFLSGNTLLGSANSAPFSYQWTDLAEGSYTVFARATDDAGNVTTSSPVSVVVRSLPFVTLTASDDQAGEFGQDNLLGFTISRDGSSVEELNVQLASGGTASAGDFINLPQNVTIPAGESTITIALTVDADELIEGTETLTIALQESPHYYIGSPGLGMGTVSDRPFQQWLLDSNLLDSGGDGDNDGLPNLLEYYHGTDANDATSHETLVVSPSDEGTFAVEFSRNQEWADVTGEILWSSDLITWHSSDESDGSRTIRLTTIATSPPEANPETLRATATLAEGLPITHLYFRLLVSLDSES